MGGSIGRREALRAALMALPAAAVARSGVAAAATTVATGAAPPAEPVARLAHGEEALPAVETPELAPSAPPAPVSSTRPVPELFVGMKVGRCVVVSVGPIERGAVPVVLKAPDGSVFGIDVLKHDRFTPGVSRAGSLAVYLNNGGAGLKDSVEEHGLAAMALAKWLARREALGRPVPSLLTLRQRAPLLAVPRF